MSERKLEEINGRNVLAQMFVEKAQWKTQGEIRAELKKRGVSVSQPTLTRWLLEIKARKEDGVWEILTTQNQKLLELEGAMKGIINEHSNFYTSSVKVCVFRTQDDCNHWLASKIEDIFENEVLSTICPNRNDIIIYYRRKKGDDKESDLLITLRKIARKSKGEMAKPQESE